MEFLFWVICAALVGALTDYMGGESDGFLVALVLIVLMKLTDKDE